MEVNAFLAAQRFGLGRRPQDPLPADPLAWLEAQIAPPAPLPPPTEGGLAAASAAYRGFLAAPPGMTAEAGRTRVRVMQAEMAAWAAHCLASEQPLQDRLTAFWLNHFTVSRRVPNAGLFLGDYLRQAIRPHIFGRFEDMLLAVARHPAMLLYLGNAGSIGPQSRGGQATRRGLNENLAREILELHTLSPAGGYSQADVGALARLLTGWGVAREREGAGFVFRAGNHEPGAKTLMGRRYEEGEAGGEAALRWLARHPATHRHLAGKLARHFVADAPPAAAEEALFGALRDSGGDLGAASRALVRLPQAWEARPGKLRPPADFALAVCRALPGRPDLAAHAVRGMVVLGQPLWDARQPNGWSDLSADWATPAGALRRVEWSYAIAALARGADPREVGRAVLGPLASAGLVAEIGRAGSPRDAFTLLFTSPEFQRR